MFENGSRVEVPFLAAARGACLGVGTLVTSTERPIPLEVCHKTRIKAIAHIRATMVPRQTK